MELIAASRIVKAQQRVDAARPYSEQITKVIANLASAGAGLDHPLLVVREPVARVGLVIITADRGLAGAYNSNVIRLAEKRIAEETAAGRDVAIVPVGKKIQGYCKYRGHAFDQSYVGMSDKPTFEDASQVARYVMELYEASEVDIVEIVSTQFFSAFTQRPVVRRLLPLEPPESQEDAGPHSGAAAAHGEGPQASYEFEPEPDGILDRLLPRYVEARLFAAMLDSAASEHAARQRAMKTATDNAEELIETLTRVANQARQSEITTEIMEIVGGAEALRQAAKAKEEMSE